MDPKAPPVDHSLKFEKDYARVGVMLRVGAFV
jgi:hypothetical protein